MATASKWVGVGEIVNKTNTNNIVYTYVHMYLCMNASRANKNGTVIN